MVQGPIHLPNYCDVNTDTPIRKGSKFLKLNATIKTLVPMAPITQLDFLNSTSLQQTHKKRSSQQDDDI